MASSIADLRTLLAEKFPATPATPVSFMATGLPPIDNATGGLPRSALTECSGSVAGVSLLLHALLGAVTSQRAFAALIDPASAFDPCGVPPHFLPRLLWVRPENAERSLKAADLLLRDGNLPLVMLDLHGETPRRLHRLPATSWHRLQRLAEAGTAVLLVLTPQPSIEAARLRIVLRTSLTLEAVASPRTELAAGLEVTIQRARPALLSRTA